jgi:hypothetical protein
MTLNDKIAKLGSRFKKMNIAEGIIFLTVNFPQDWKINDKILEKHNVKVMPTEDYEGYYFAATLDVGIDSIFNAIDDTITFNEVAGIKKALFLEKVSELQRIFEEEALDVLQTIEFKYKKKKPKNLKKNETDNIENEEEVAVCQAG